MGKTALVTGASDGIGLEIARGLAGAGATVILPVRNREKCARAIARIQSSVPDARLELRDLDLTRLDSVSSLIGELRDDATPIDYLVMNAGIVMLGDRRRHVTADGLELHFQTNFLGHFALVAGLLPLLRVSRARLVAQVSLAARFGRIEWDDLQLQRHYSALRAYASSKAALGLFATELARRSDAGDWGVRVGISHPGVAPNTSIASPLRAIATGSASNWLSAKLGNSPERAALPALMSLTTDAPARAMCAPSRSISGPPKWRRPYRSITDTASAARIWDVAERLCMEHGGAQTRHGT